MSFLIASHKKKIKELKATVSDLEGEVHRLKRILVGVTHHEGALEENREVWEPIVVEELARSSKENQEGIKKFVEAQRKALGIS